MKKYIMSNLRHIFLIPLLLLLLTNFVFSGVAQTPEPIELIFGYVDIPGTISANLHEIHSRKIEEATNGRVRVITYPAESLFKNKDLMTALENGITDLAWAALATYPGRFNLIEVMFLPFLHGNPPSGSLPSYDVNTRVVDELFNSVPEVQEEFSKFKVLYITGQEDYYIASVKKPIHTLEDLKGLKIRVVGRYATKVINQLGATAVSIPVTDLYDAASKGVVDGAMVISDQIDSFNFHQVLPYWTQAPFWNSICVLFMNREKWESLPSDIQEEIMSVSGVTRALEQGYARFGTDAVAHREALQEKDKKPITWYQLPAEEVERWREIGGKPIWEEWVKEMEEKGLPGKKVLEKTIELYKKYY